LWRVARLGLSDGSTGMLCLLRVGVAGFVPRANKRPRRSGVTSPRGGWAIKEEPAKLARSIIHACGCRSLRIINGDRGENEPFLERNAVFACSGFGFLLGFAQGLG
jgi:hypothetical protein